MRASPASRAAALRAGVVLFYRMQVVLLLGLKLDMVYISAEDLCGSYILYHLFNFSERYELGFLVMFLQDFVHCIPI